MVLKFLTHKILGLISQNTHNFRYEDSPVNNADCYYNYTEHISALCRRDAAFRISAGGTCISGGSTELNCQEIFQSCLFESESNSKFINSSSAKGTFP